MQAERALDPNRYFIIVPNMFGNGLSSSPSNTPPPLDRAAFPNVTMYDNVVCQHRLVTEHLGISRIKLVVGASMGAQQAFQWGALYSDMVQAIAPLCGSARTSPHNYLFLDGVKAALLADAAFADVHRGLRHRRPERRQSDAGGAIGAPRLGRTAMVTRFTSGPLRGPVQAAACAPESRRRRFHSRGVSSRTSRAGWVETRSITSRR
jgi:pimeloyl-ACP methyl ester carboxylesterase